MKQYLDPTISYDLRANIIRANNLPKADIIGTIDPFIKILVPVFSHEKYIPIETFPRVNEINPIYNYKGNISNVDISRDILIEVWDYDNFNSNDLVCTKTLSFQKDLIEKYDGHISKKEIILNCVKKYKPFHAGSESTLTLSLGISPSYQYYLNKFLQKCLQNDNSQFIDKTKLQLCYFLGNNLYLKLSFKNHLKLSILDCNEVRQQIIYFEMSGKDCKSKMCFKKTQKFGLQVKRQIKLREKLNRFKNLHFLLPLLKVVIASPFETIIENKVFKELSEKHEWNGSLKFRDVKYQAVDVISDVNTKSIYMVESDLYFTRSQFETQTFHQRICILNPKELEGLHVEIIYNENNNNQHNDGSCHTIVEYHGNVKLDGDLRYQVSSEVNDLTYPVDHSKLTFSIWKKKNYIQYNVLDFIPIL
ncbi:hypothetical protein ABK040_014722 [Willaertia magna]